MFSKLDKLKKIYKSLYAENSRLYAELDDYDEEFGCLNCDEYNSGAVREISNRYEKCEKCKHYATVNDIAIGIDQLQKKIDEFVEGEFSEAIFHHYGRKKPRIIDTSNGQVAEWNDMFEPTFGKLTKNQRYLLVGICMNNGAYKIK